MNVLFVHQNMPGQYRHILRALCREGSQHHCVGLGIHGPGGELPESFQYVRYRLQRGNTNGIHPLVLETETKIIRAEACTKAAEQLKHQGFTPDLICAHPGWGEALFLKAVWPHAPLLCYQEFWYNLTGFDCGFDPEFQSEAGWQSEAGIRMKNAYLHLTFEQADWNVTPTRFQRSSFPTAYQERMSTIHDGIDIQRAAPDPAVAPLTLPDGTCLRRGESIVTFVNRRLEPYRGCHTFLRALPELQCLAPEARVVIVGVTKGVSYGPACPEGEWKDRFLAEIEGRYDPARVHVCGSLPYSNLLQLLKLSACHVYLTYPFVLSWSLLEAMSTACPIVGSATAPVQEVIEDGANGLLVDFFRPDDLAAAVADLLRHRERAAELGARARSTVVRRFSLDACLPRHLGLMDLVASRSLSA